MSRALVINVTGAATGFGALTARTLAKAGHTVFAGLHHKTPALVQEMESFCHENKVDLRPVHQDMLSDDSVQASVQEMLSQAGQVDVVVHNCGHMVLGPTEAFTAEQLAQQYDVNVLSTQRLNRAVLPHMRQRRSGLLVWVSSSSVHGASPPMLAPYFAAKAGMDSLAMAYELELSRWGVESSIVVPGAFTKGTNHFASSGRPADKEVEEAYAGKGAPYEGMAETLAADLARFEPETADPAEVARRIVEVVDMAHGTRPSRIHIDPAGDGAEIVSGVRDRIRKDRLALSGHADLFTVQ